MKIFYCDNCKEQIAKEPNEIVANGSKMDICNKCWAKFVKLFRRTYTGVISDKGKNK